MVPAIRTQPRSCPEPLSAGGGALRLGASGTAGRCGAVRQSIRVALGRLQLRVPLVPFKDVAYAQGSAWRDLVAMPDTQHACAILPYGVVA